MEVSAFDAFESVSEYFETHGLSHSEIRKYVQNNQNATDLLIKKKEALLAQRSQLLSQKEADCEQKAQKYALLRTRLGELISRIQTTLQDEEFFAEWKRSLESMNASLRKDLYTRIASRIEEIQKQLVENIKTASHDIDIAPIILLHKIVEVLEQTPWRNLKKNSKSLLDRYHGLYLTKLKGDFKAALSAMKWPVLRIVDSKQSQTLNPPENRVTSDDSAPEGKTFSAILDNLLAVDPAVLSCKPENLGIPMELIIFDVLMEPLNIRFRYHFEGNKKTNNLAKPELYLVFTMDTIKSHIEFIEENVAHIMRSHLPFYFDAKTEFIRRVTFLVKNKLARDFPKISNHSEILLHTFREIAQFDNEVKLLCDESEAIEPCLTVLLKDAEKWETVYSVLTQDFLQRFHRSLSLDKAWKLRYQERSELDLYKHANIAEELVVYLKEIEILAGCIHDPKLRLQMIFELQGKLVSQYTDSIAQILEETRDEPPTTSLLQRTCTVANSAFYIEHILTGFEDQQFYIDVAFTATEDGGISDMAIGDHGPSIFGHVVKELSKIRKTCLTRVLSHLTKSFTTSGKHYFQRRKLWSVVDLTPLADTESLIVSPDIVTLVASLQQQFDVVEQMLHPDLCRSVIRNLFEKIDQSIFHDIIDFFRFKLGESKQFLFDMDYFMQFSRIHLKEKDSFGKLKDVLKVLNLSLKAFSELSEALKQNHPAIVEETLENFGINVLNIGDVSDVLEKILLS